MIVLSDGDTDSKTPTSPTSTRHPTTYSNTSRSVTSPSYVDQQESYYDEALPEYTPSQSPQTPILSSSYPNPRPAAEATRQARARFARAFLFAAAVYILFVTFSRGFVLIVHLQTSKPRLGKGDRPLEVIPGGHPAGPIEQDGQVISCFPGADFNLYSTPGTEWDAQYSRSISYSIPASSNLVYFLSRGDLGLGSFNFKLAEEDGDDIQVEVEATYYKEEVFRNSSVCSLKRSDGGHGVGFFTPRVGNDKERLAKENAITFNSTIIFPRRTIDNPLLIKSLVTDMEVWPHYLDSLRGLVRFDAVSLKALVGDLHLSDISARNVSIVSIAGQISGNFQVSNTLTLTSTTSPISANIIMRNNNGTQPTSLNISTSLGFVEANVALIVDDYQFKSPNPPLFLVNAETSLAPLKLNFSDAPAEPFVKLNLTARTAMAAANITLHPTYEGSILQSMWGSFSTIPKFQETKGIQDPSGQGRQRKTSQRTSGRTLETFTQWGSGEDRRNYGRVKVSTIMGENIVILG